MTPSTRRVRVFRIVSLGNAAAAAWLSVMFVTLRHAAYERNAAIAAVIAGFCAVVPWATSSRTPIATRAAVTGGSLVLAAAGLWTLRALLDPAADFEGYTLVIACGWIAQGAAAVPAMRMRWQRGA